MQRPAARGAAALAVTLLLLFMMTLGAAFVQRNLLFEQRASANQYGAAQAFEAAEAGLQWIEAQLNANRRLGADCLPTTDAAADSFRERYLRLEVASGLLRPRGPPATASGQPGCLRTSAGFRCSCPASGAAALARPAGDGPFPAFRAEFLAGDRPGVVRVIAVGCNSARPPCTDAATGRADSTARIEVQLGLVGALRRLPAALLTAGASVDAGAALFSTPGRGIRLEPSPNPERFFAAWFGLDKSRWQTQPVVTRIACRSDCAAALAAAVDDRGAGALLWVDGDLDLSGPVVLGSAARPVLIVVGGNARLRGAVELHGALYAGTVAWTDAAPGSGAAVFGAMVVERDYGGGAAVTFRDDPAIVAMLTRFAGSFARVSGSWRDF